MKVEVREAPQPKPPREIVITLTEDEAGMLMAIVGSIKGQPPVREAFTRPLYYELGGRGIVANIHSLAGMSFRS
jgi:hypothetical protein